jgi:hypothetical protein
MSAPTEEREFRLGWSLWRRAHQAVAKRCHKASHAAEHGPSRELPPDPARPAPAATPISTPISTHLLSDEKWERLRALLPPQKPPKGGGPEK